MPASTFSSRSYSNRARRFRATTLCPASSVLAFPLAPPLLAISALRPLRRSQPDRTSCERIIKARRDDRQSAPRESDRSTPRARRRAGGDDLGLHPVELLRT